jgi:hypothetical protein
LDLAYDVARNGSHSVHVVEIEDDRRGFRPAILVDGAVTLEAGASIPSGGEWERFRGVAINDVGTWIVSGERSGPGERDTVLAVDGVVVLEEGEQVGDIVLAPEAAIVAVDIDNDGRFAALWSTRGFGDQYVIFACSASDVAGARGVLRTGVAAPSGWRITGFEGGGHGAVLQLGPDGWLYAWVKLQRDDEVPRQAVVASRLPGCPAVQSLGQR